MPPLPLAEISDSVPWFILACVIVAIIAMIGLGITLRFVRELKQNIVAELGSELERGQKREKIDVQQPLVVQAHSEFATVTALREVEKQAHGRMNRERDEAHGRIDKIEEKLDDQTEKLNERIDAIPQRTIALLNETKELHTK